MIINNPGHLTKMAAMPIYDKNPSNTSSLELNETWLVVSMTRVL